MHLKNRQIVRTPISHSTLKVFWKKSRLKPARFFAHFTSLVWPKITTLIWLLIDIKKPKKREQILKKRQRTNKIQILWIVKNHDVLNNSRFSFAATKKLF